MGLCIGCFEWVADMKKITVQDRAEKFINELGSMQWEILNIGFPFVNCRKIFPSLHMTLIEYIKRIVLNKSKGYYILAKFVLQILFRIK